MKHMRAVVQERYGAPEEVLHLREVAIPAPIVGRTFSLEGARGNPRLQAGQTSGPIVIVP
jgi:hypothetical protein